MRKLSYAVLLVLTLWVSQVAGLVRGQGVAMKPADLVLRNGAVYTLDGARSWANEPVGCDSGGIDTPGPGDWRRTGVDSRRSG